MAELIAGQFLQELWHGYEGDGVVTFAGPGKSVLLHHPARDLASWDDEDEAVFRDQDVYTFPSLRPAGIAESKAGARHELVALAAFAIDIDIDVEGHHKSKKLPRSLEEAAPIIDAGPEPTHVVWTGGGVHLWWFFSPIALPDRAARAKAQRASERFHEPFHRVAKELGYTLDNTAGIEHRFRLPGTVNTKKDRKPIEIFYRTEATYSYGDLSRLTDRRGKPLSMEIPASPLEDDEVEESEESTKERIDSVDGVEAVRLTLRKVRPDHKHRTTAELILKGESFADDARDDAMTQIIAVIVNGLVNDKRTASSRDIAEALRPSLAVWAAEPDAEKTLADEIGKVIEKSDRMFDKRAREDAERASRAAVVRRALRVNGEPATPETVPDAQLPQLALIQYKSFYFAHSFGWLANPDKTGYLGPFIKEELVSQLDGIWENSPDAFELEKFDKGVVRAKTAAELVQEYGTGALDTVGHLFLQDSYFDVATRHYHRAFCPFRVLEPRFDDNIDTWLRLMGGDQQEKLLDWIAAVPQLDRQNCALYLEGPPAIGKSSLLGFGLSRLWRTTGPAHFANLMAGFNADMFSCPLVLLDEGLPKSASHTSAFIRSLIGSSEHTFNQKNQPMHKVLGNVRLIIAANSDAVLSQLSNEEMGEQDLEAVAGRFLHIVGQREAADWIKEQNAKDRGLIDAWVKDDLIAKHAIWLAENRTIISGKRFLVEGEATSMHRSLLTRGEKQGLVLEWLCRCLLDPQRVERDLAVKKQSDLLKIGEGNFLVNTQAVVDNWAIFRKPEQNLTPSTIGRILARLSHGQRRVSREDRLRLHDINFENIKYAAFDLQLNSAVMESNLNREA